MRVIGVIDILKGQAVHARAGTRDLYQPLGIAAGKPVRGDAVALARIYLDDLGITELYAADLDAISSGRKQDAVIGQLTALGAPLWLDAGVSSVEAARSALSLGATHAIVGLETLESIDALDNICDDLGGDRVAFSLDLRNGAPVFAPEATGIKRSPSPVTLAERARVAGVGSIILLDMARVGTGRGPDFGLIERVRESVPGLTLIYGGGVRGMNDLENLAAAGIDRTLVATALQLGQLSRADIERGWSERGGPDHELS